MTGQPARTWWEGFSNVWIAVVSFPLLFLIALAIVEPPRDPGYLLMVWPWLGVLALAGLSFAAAAVAMGAAIRRVLYRRQESVSIWAGSRTIVVCVVIAYGIALIALALG